MLPDHQTRQVRESAFIFTSLTIRGWIERQRQTRCLFPPFRTFLPHSSPSPHIKRVKRESLSSSQSAHSLWRQFSSGIKRVKRESLPSTSLASYIKRERTPGIKRIKCERLPSIIDTASWHGYLSERHQTHQVRAPASTRAI